MTDHAAHPVLTAAKIERILNARADMIDRRDYPYQPMLDGLRASVDSRDEPWWRAGCIRDQGNTHTCTAQALAAVIDHLRARDLMLNRQSPGKDVGKRTPRARPPKELTKPWASADMLYNIGRFHDDYLGEDYDGSSIRAALKGFYYNGVCSGAAIGKSQHGKKRGDQISGNFRMTRQIMKAARKVQLGAYYRVRLRLADLHAALNEVGMVIASADIHHGWQNPKRKIPFNADVIDKTGRHAFVIIGYTHEGLWVQNSWGRSWGDGGVALWTYEDWSASIVDQWVMRLAAPFDHQVNSRNLPQIATNRRSQMPVAGFEADGTETDILPPTRLDVIGHVASITKGRLSTRGPYHIERDTLEETITYVQDKAGDRYTHLYVHFMGLQRNEATTMAALRDALPVFKKNKIYPFFMFLEKELSDTVHDIVEAAVTAANDLGGLVESIEKDSHVESTLSVSAMRLMEEILNSARMTFTHSTDDPRAMMFDYMLVKLHKAFAQDRLKLHFGAHGFGADFLARLLGHFATFPTKIPIASINLLSPMITGEDMAAAFSDQLLDRREVPANRSIAAECVEIEQLNILLQSESARAADRPFPGYSGNWPYLWSRIVALSRLRDGDGAGITKMAGPGLGLDRPSWPFLARAKADDFRTAISGAGKGVITVQECDAKHRDFDLNTDTLDQVIRNVLGQKPAVSFRQFYPYRNSMLHP